MIAAHEAPAGWPWRVAGCALAQRTCGIERCYGHNEVFHNPSGWQARKLIAAYSPWCGDSILSAHDLLDCRLRKAVYMHIM
jgi:hypothetical protein